MIRNARGTVESWLRGRVLDFLKVGVLIYRDETGSAWPTGFWPMRGKFMNALVGVRPVLWAVIMIPIGVLCSLVPALVAAEEKIKGRLIVEDVMARPGTPVTLKARLIEEGVLGKGLGGEIIVFTVLGQRVGTALTGGDGRAFLEFRTRMRGNHNVVANVETSPRVESAEGMGNLASWERRRPILLVDVATLIQEQEKDSIVNALPTLPFNVNLTAFGDPQEDAPQALSKLSEFYFNVIYLHDYSETVLQETREWLRQHKFPVGIAKRVPPKSKALLAFMETLKEGGWDNLEAGIGRTWEFARTLVKQRIKTIIFPEPSEKRQYPRRAKIVKSWKEVRKQL